ncbi:MAG: YjgP/YjgQ family permease [Ignavibacteria bacterium]|jgi:lipopolysaccharide export system permease protein|nr:YjgP/YjgQ family permease [Ignavibacteria bacterium]MCU7498696.1 YjgP/YjgQ family permease [Ignavibacteria bacterium]MCU7513903.1 YjgP/YjgQ family permease [Ignavibacteria bacterium]MCU7519246.1 YjgP/YjgQ family permease [Ignavibacteria bacterium]MCU7525535.1 YjgP/YjgQ family permease [Ignavibacteria bacterium]
MILFRYILRNHAGPFIFSLLTLIFIFLFNFLTKFADRLVGKGLGFWIITKLIAYNLAWMVVLVVPMSILVATLMAYGNMSHNNEIAIMKASGVSVYKMIMPPFILSIVIGFLLVEFNNKIYPDANHAARILIQDISNKKPTLSLIPGLFSQEVANYSILVRNIDEKTNTLEGVTIYDYSDPMHLNVVTAKKGKIYFSGDQKKLIMDLSSGEIHETSPGSSTLYRKLLFTNHRIAMDAEQFSFQQSTPGGQRGDRELSAQDMMVIVDSLKNIQNRFQASMNRDIRDYFLKDSTYMYRTPYSQSSGELLLYRVQDRVNAAKNILSSDMENVDSYRKRIDSYMVEVHKKYSIPFACIIFVLIGAPLGIMTRRGGMGVAAGISVIFFLIYWAFLIGGEKFADRGLLSPFWGMWSANFVLGILGILLTIKSARETVNINLSFLSKLIPRQLRAPQEENENN